MESAHMNPNYPMPRGCWVDTRTEGKVVVNDYPTWRERNDLANLPPFYNRNESIPAGKPYQKEFATLAEAHAFMTEENYAQCDMPACLRPKKPVKTPTPKKPSLDDFDF